MKSSRQHGNGRNPRNALTKRAAMLEKLAKDDGKYSDLLATVWSVLKEELAEDFANWVAIAKTAALCFYSIPILLRRPYF